MLLSFALSIIEKTLNRFLQLDPESKKNLLALAGKVIVFESYDFKVYWIFTQDKILLTHQYDGLTDASLSGSVFDFMRLGFNQDTATVFASDIKMTGDTEVIQAFKNLFSQLNIDWEEQLSKMTGDVIAYQIGSAIRLLNTWAKQSSKTLQANLTEYLQEEARLLPTNLELNDFFVEVDKLRNDVERIEARMLRLKKESA